MARARRTGGEPRARRARPADAVRPDRRPVRCVVRRAPGRPELLFLDEPTAGFDPEQWAGQTFPLYWLGLGTRSALLPANLASVEVGHSWRHLATFGVLSAWAVAGLLAAPILLRWVARRESGSSVAARREKVLRQAAA